MGVHQFQSKMKSDFNTNAVLIYGPRKSGSTLLTSLLDGGNDLLMLTGELKIKKFYKQGPPHNLVEAYFRKGRNDFYQMLDVRRENNSILLKARPDFAFSGLSKTQTNEEFDMSHYLSCLNSNITDAPTSFGDMVKMDVSSFAASVRKKTGSFSCWAIKEVGGDPERLIPYFHSQFSASKIILNIRHPMFVVRSLILEASRNTPGIRKRDMRTKLRRRMMVGTIWKECREAQDFVNYVYSQADREFVVVYEQITENTEKEMRRLAEYLEIPFDPIFCYPSTLGQSAVVRTSSKKSHSVFSQVSDWTHDLKPHQIFVMKLFNRVAPKLYHRAGKPFITYSQLLDKLSVQNSP